MRICVFGASSNLIDESYIHEIERLCEMMGNRGHGLVFGAGANGVMGASARGMKRAGGEIIGVVPAFFQVDGVLYDKCTQLILTESMRERKYIMETKADAFIVAPGGFGTFEEFFEVLTLKQLKQHAKPIVVLNINGYYNNMRDLIEIAMKQEFIKSACVRLYKFCDTSEDALDYLEKYTEPAFEVGDVRNLEANFTYDIVKKIRESR